MSADGSLRGEDLRRNAEVARDAAKVDGNP